MSEREAEGRQLLYDEALALIRSDEAADDENWSGVDARQALFLHPDALLRHRRERQAAPEPPEAPAEAAPVQEAAHVANAQTQRVLVLYRTDLGNHNGVVPCVRDHYAFLQFLIEQGFSYTGPDPHNDGIFYERVRPE